MDQLVLLGTGTPNSEVHRSGSGVAIVVDDIPYLFDSGPGIIRRCQAAFEKGVKGLDLSNLDRVFLTHLHSDHTTGIPDLLLSPWVLGRREPLKVQGPPGTRNMVGSIHRAYEQDIEVRVCGLERANDTGHRFIVKEIDEGVVHEDERIKISAFRVKHTSFRDAFGYRTDTGNRRIAISGDRVISGNVEEQYRDLDILVHEVYSTSGFCNKSPGWKAYHRNAHTSSTELAEVLCRVRPKLTILYHQLLWGTSSEDILNEIREIYDGEVIFGDDLLIL